jgi:phospholipase A1
MQISNWGLFRVALLLLSSAASAQSQEPELGADAPAPEKTAAAPDQSPPHGLQVDPDAYAIISAVRGLSFHKPMYAMPVSFSRDYETDQTEMVFQISAKQRLFGSSFYLGYTQKSFWQPYNEDKSSPFRETVYNPEIFYRWIPEPDRYYHLGADLGFEHESNGRALPDSRSWNRLYAAAFQARGPQLIYAKVWYRIPEDAKKSPEDPKGDDNPDIERYYGYGELRWQRQIGGKQLLGLMGRGNPTTGRGAVALDWSIPSPDGYAFFGVSLWHGYGESLIDYDNSITRLAIGVMFSR